MDLSAGAHPGALDHGAAAQDADPVRRGYCHDLHVLGAAPWLHRLTFNQSCRFVKLQHFPVSTHNCEGLSDAMSDLYLLLTGSGDKGA